MEREPFPAHFDELRDVRRLVARLCCRAQRAGRPSETPRFERGSGLHCGKSLSPERPGDRDWLQVISMGCMFSVSVPNTRRRLSEVSCGLGSQQGLVTGSRTRLEGCPRCLAALVHGESLR